MASSSSRCGRTARGVLAHDDASDGRVTDHEPDVGPDLPVQATEVLARRLPAPRHARFERFEGHAFHPGQHFRQVIAGIRSHGGDGEAAIPGDHRGHAVHQGRTEVGIPEHLGVVVGVDVDESGSHDAAIGSDHPVGRVLEGPDANDAPSLYTDVGRPSGCARPVDDSSARDRQVEHRSHGGRDGVETEDTAGVSLHNQVPVLVGEMLQPSPGPLDRPRPTRRSVRIVGFQHDPITAELLDDTGPEHLVDHATVDVTSEQGTRWFFHHQCCPAPAPSHRR